MAYIFSTSAGLAGSPGNVDGTNSAARFNSPGGVALDSSGNLYVSDILNHTIRRLTFRGTNCVVSTLCGQGVPGSSDGTNTDAGFDRPNGIAVDKHGTLFVADHYNHTIREIAPSGTNWVVTTIAGSAGLHGNSDGTNNDARFWSPTGIAVDDNDKLYVVDTANFIIREIDPVGTNWIVSTIAGSVPPGSDPISGFMDGTNGQAQFDYPYGIALDPSGRLFVTDWGNNAVRQLQKADTNWVVSTIAGTSGVMGSDDGPGLLATFNLPNDLCIDPAGNIYVTDQSNDTLRKVIPGQGQWTVSTIAGAPLHFGTSDGVGSNARFKLPWGIAASPDGGLFVADYANQTIRTAIPIPVLGINLALQNVLLSWPAAAANYTPEVSGSFDPFGSWTRLTNAAVTNGLDVTVSDAPRTPPAFYRLHKN